MKIHFYDSTVNHFDLIFLNHFYKLELVTFILDHEILDLLRLRSINITDSFLIKLL